MKNLSRGEKKTLVILALVFAAVLLVLLALMNISLFFLALIALVVGIYFLRVRKPEFFSIFEKKQPAPALGVNARAASIRQFSARIVLVYYSGSGTQQIQVNKPEFTIGRGPECDFVLTGNTSISKLHAVIRYDEARHQSTLTDHHSRNGTKLNGQALVPDMPYPLRDGDMIQIDDRNLTVQHKNY